MSFLCRKNLDGASSIRAGAVVNHRGGPELRQLHLGPLIVDTGVVPILECLADASALGRGSGDLPEWFAADLDAPWSR